MRLTSFLIILFLFLPAASLPAAEADGIAAVVNGEVITKKQLEARLTALARGGRSGGGGALREKALDDLIDQELINQAAKAKGVYVSEADITEAVDRIKKQNNINEAQFRASLAHSGVSMEAFRENVRLELTRSRVLGSKAISRIVITDKEITDYLKGEGPRLEAAAKGPGLRVIFLPLNPKNPAASVAEAQRVKKEIEGGLSFAEAAAKYSQGPGRDSGGDPGDSVSMEKLPPPLRAVLNKLPPGRPTEPINGGESVLLMARAEAEAPPAPGPDGSFSPEARENARRLLERRKMQDNFQKWIEDLKRQAVIRRLKY